MTPSYTCDLKRARLISNLLSYVKSKPEGSTSSELREFIFTLDPTVDDTNFTAVFNFLLSHSFIVTGFSGTNPSRTIYQVVPNVFVRFTPTDSQSNGVVRYTPGDSEGSFDVHRVELSDHYPTFNQLEEMEKVLNTFSNIWLGAMIINAALLELKPVLSLAFIKTKIIVTEQLLIARVLTRLAHEPKVIDYFTVKAYLTHPTFERYTRRETRAEVGLMAHHYSVNSVRTQLPGVAQIQPTIDLGMWLQREEEVESA